MLLADLRFDKGHAFEDRIWSTLHLPINFTEGSGLREFFLVAEFTRSRIRLTEESVGTILLSYFGGRASLFKVCKLHDHLFKFSVSSLDVGFAIYNGGNISLPEFNLCFLLWGPNDPKRRSLADPELEEGWTLVSRNKRQNSYEEAVRAPRFFDQSRNNSTRHGRTQAQSSVAVTTVFDRLQIPINLGFNGARNKQIQNSRQGAISGINQGAGPASSVQRRAFCVR